ncbi:uncharacterized protein LOC141640723 [Silene latifolia]|uniref:uncharacterized protein LOC141640723 n=1 Tax=Silene latifolia TaxID=37657 RepID=UPI003D78177F
MGGEESWSWQPIASPTLNGGRSEVHFSQFDTSVNAVSFGFVATAILISMFLFMAIFERFLQPHFPHFPLSAHHDIESQPPFNPKLPHSSPKFYNSQKTEEMRGQKSDKLDFKEVVCAWFNHFCEGTLFPTNYRLPSATRVEELGLLLVIYHTIFLDSSANVSVLEMRKRDSKFIQRPLQPKMTVYSQGVSVLMPGEETPTFIAQPVPLPCPPDRIQWPPPKHKLVPDISQTIDTSTFLSTSRNL